MLFCRKVTTQKRVVVCNAVIYTLDVINCAEIDRNGLYNQRFRPVAINNYHKVYEASGAVEIQFYVFCNILYHNSTWYLHRNRV